MLLIHKDYCLILLLMDKDHKKMNISTPNCTSRINPLPKTFLEAPQ